MTQTIEEKAHALINEVRKERDYSTLSGDFFNRNVHEHEALCRAIDQLEDLRVEAKAQFDRGYYEGCANPIVRHDAMLTKMNEWCEAVAVEWGQGSQTHNVARDGVDIVRAALEQNK